MPDFNKDAKEIFANSLELPADQREAFIQRAAGDNKELAQRAKELLRAHEKAGTFLETPTNHVLDEALPTPTSHVEELPESEPYSGDERVGCYRIVRRLGEGHYGEVFEGEQTEPIHRRVAIKILKRGVDSRQILARFRAERQTVAMLDHPNLCRFLDAGETEDGRPYFVIDLVRGSRITEYSDSNHLPISDRVRLLVETCRGVEHAHQAGLVHRDLKPGNILVEVRDDRAIPRVIDFGIARALSNPAVGTGRGTIQGQVLGTPGYMSPEQITGKLDIDARSDVFSLGCVLFELLTGSTPISRDELIRMPIGEMQRAVSESESPLPSDTLTSAGDALRSVARRRGVESTRLPSLIRGELDWICAKALARDRTVRYATAGEFADDLQRWLDGRKVLANPTRSAGSGLRRFAGRHRRGLRYGAVAAGILILIVSFAAGWIPGVDGVPQYMTRLIQRYTSGVQSGLPKGAWVNGITTNSAGGIYATVGGGYKNRVATEYGLVGGGYENLAGGPSSVVGGGRHNIAEGDNATVAGGQENTVRNYGATISGGKDNEVSSPRGTIGGGLSNRVHGGESVVSGGRENIANDSTSVIGGGLKNVIGYDNSIPSEADGSTIGGGINNKVYAKQGTIAGGLHNYAKSSYATVGGGYYNIAGFSGTRNGIGSSATVAGGYKNQATGSYSAIPGGHENIAKGESSFAAGTKANALHNGSFVWSDLTKDNDTPVASTAPNSFTARARGGFNFLTGLNTTTEIKPGEGGWSSYLSSNGWKDAKPYNHQNILEQISQLNLQSYRYAEQSTPDQHLAPTAEQFHELFDLGSDNDDHILTTDLDGITLAAIQALTEQLKSQQAILNEQSKRIEALESLLKNQ